MKYNPLSLTVIWALFALAVIPNQASAAPGDIYALEGNGTIIRITPAGVTSTFAMSSSGVNLAFDSSGNLFVVGGSEIIKINPAGTASTFAVNNLASSIAIGSSGSIFVGESPGNTISKYPPSGGAKTTFATGFGSVSDLAFDALGNLLAVDYSAGVVYRLTPGV